MKSIEHLLYEIIIADEKALCEIAETTTPESRTALLVRMGVERGLPVTPEAVDAFFSNHAHELSDGELEQVVGGKDISGDTGGWLGIWNDKLVGTSGDDNIDGGRGDDVWDRRVKK